MRAALVIGLTMILMSLAPAMRKSAKPVRPMRVKPAGPYLHQGQLAGGK